VVEKRLRTTALGGLLSFLRVPEGKYQVVINLISMFIWCCR